MEDCTSKTDLFGNLWVKQSCMDFMNDEKHYEHNVRNTPRVCLAMFVHVFIDTVRIVMDCPFKSKHPIVSIFRSIEIASP